MSATAVDHFCDVARTVITIEQGAVAGLLQRIDHRFQKACQYLLQCPGRVVVMGMGKSGHIAKKIAATLASTGTPAMTIHPAEASHGDLGMVAKGDIVLAISYSGETEELVRVLPFLKGEQVKIIALSGNPHSSLVRMADVWLDVSVEKEACPLDLAPTASTTATLVMGDALAVALLKARNFSRQDFARFHPAGSLGRELLASVSDLMRTGDAIPQVNVGATVAHALLEVTTKSLGMTTVMNAEGELLGVFTDGDLRRAIDRQCNLHETQISTVMTIPGLRIPASWLAVDALKLMNEKKVTALPVIDEEGQLVGIIHMHDLLRAGLKG